MTRQEKRDIAEFVMPMWTMFTVVGVVWAVIALVPLVPMVFFNVLGWIVLAIMFVGAPAWAIHTLRKGGDV